MFDQLEYPSVEVLPAHYAYAFGIGFGFDGVAVLGMDEFSSDSLGVVLASDEQSLLAVHDARAVFGRGTVTDLSR